MIDRIREITKEEYDLVMSNHFNGAVIDSLKDRFFSVAQIAGYGVYCARVEVCGDKYYLKWTEGISCD